MDTLLTPQALGRLHAALRNIAPLTEDELHALTMHVRPLHLPKGASLLQAGETALVTGFVLSGGLREYYVLDDGTERTKGFNMAGEFAGSLSDLLSDRPSSVWITAQTHTDLLCTPWPIYTQLSHTMPAWAHFARRFAEALYLIKVEREFELLALDAGQRYERALQRWPTLASVFTQKDIASYVGVTPVHLSRLRTSPSADTPPKRRSNKKG